jgi:hypothetical protein
MSSENVESSSSGAPVVNEVVSRPGIVKYVTKEMSTRLHQQILLAERIEDNDITASLQLLQLKMTVLEGKLLKTKFRITVDRIQSLNYRGHLAPSVRSLKRSRHVFDTGLDELQEEYERDKDVLMDRLVECRRRWCRI